MTALCSTVKDWKQTKHLNGDVAVYYEILGYTTEYSEDTKTGV